MNPEEYAQLFKLGQTHWWFVGTRNILLSSVRQRSPGDRPILDVGCGSGLMMKRLSNAGRVFGTDKDAGALKHCQQIGLSRLSRSNAETLPFQPDTFGLIVAGDLLEHCENDKAALSELYRITAPKGTLLISVPAYKGLWSTHDVALHHKRRYSKHELIQKVEAAGYTVNRVSFFNTFLFPPIAAVRVLLQRPGKEPPEQGIRYHENFRLLNGVLLPILRMEQWLLQFINFPFGLSILMVASKE
jgi:SAM-dependent methyltransferase